MSPVQDISHLIRIWQRTTELYLIGHPKPTKIEAEGDAEKADLRAIRVRFGSCIKIGNSDRFALRYPSDPAGRHGSRQAEMQAEIRRIQRAEWSKRHLKTRRSRALKYRNFICADEQSRFVARQGDTDRHISDKEKDHSSAARTLSISCP
jgi:hypothetical protein